MWYQPFYFLVLYEKLVVLLQGKYSEFWRTERKISSSSCLPWKTEQSCAMLQWKFQNSKFYQNIRVTSITMTSLVICPTLFLFFFPLFSLFMERSSPEWFKIVRCDSSTTDFWPEILVMCNFHFCVSDLKSVLSGRTTSWGLDLVPGLFPPTSSLNLS